MLSRVSVVSRIHVVSKETVNRFTQFPKSSDSARAAIITAMAVSNPTKNIAMAQTRHDCKKRLGTTGNNAVDNGAIAGSTNAIRGTELKVS